MTTNLKIDWATYEAAKHACLNWHYSKSIPVGKMVKVGAWESDQFIGVVLFAYGANNNIGKPYGLVQQECCELVRIALRDHATPVSKIMARAIKMLKKQSPGLRLIISYADTGQGHHGGIYQATNWVYEGLCKSATEYLLHGRWVHSMQVQTFIRKGDLKNRSSLDKRSGTQKHKYLFPLDDPMRKQILPLAKPYPKRTTASEAGDAGDQPDSGGATPTRTLQ